MKEWRDVPFLSGYQASNDGEVRSLDRVVYRGDKAWRIKGKLLKAAVNCDGYMRVKAGGCLFFVHTLVLSAFVSTQPDGFQACHNNGIPNDNRIDNLRWDTPKANVADRKAHGTYQYGSSNHRAKLTDEQVVHIFTSDERSIDLANKYGIKDSTVANIRRGTNWSHLTNGLRLS